MAAETIEIRISDSSAIQFISTSSGVVVTVMSPDQKKAGGMTIRGSTTLPTAAVAALKALFNKTRS